MSQENHRAEVRRDIGEEATRLVDVWSKSTYEKFHLSGATDLPRRKLGTASRSIPDPARPLIVYWWDSARPPRLSEIIASVVGFFLAAVVAASVLAYVGPARSQALVVLSRATHAPATPANLTPAGVAVPTTRGLTVRMAMTKLWTARLTLLRVEPVLGQPGVVLNSRPAPGERASPGMAVVLFVGVPPDRVQRRAGP
jgi:hypothetical protein